MLLAHETRNRALLDVLQNKGVDLSEPRLIECHFWTWSESDAANLAEDLVGRGFEILVRRPAASSRDPDLWNVEAAIRQSIKLTLRREFTDELIRAAAARSGQYDGWGTAV